MKAYTMDATSVKLIRHKMLEADIPTWAALARHVGTSRQNMCRMLKGRRPGVALRKKIAALLNVPESVVLIPTAAPGEQEPQS